MTPRRPIIVLRLGDAVFDGHQDELGVMTIAVALFVAVRATGKTMGGAV